MNFPIDKFLYIGNFIIDNLEGGYYHPDFYVNGAPTTRGGRISAQAFVKADYGRSGETMYGLDRHAGWDMWYSSPRKTSNPQQNAEYIAQGVYKYANNDAKTFWETLDRLDARHKWPHEYMGGSNRKMLQDLAIKMMYQYFLKNVWNKLDEKAQQIVLNDDKLALNYVYSAWNGIGYSNYYNKIVNAEIKKGVTDSTAINNKIINARQTSSSGLVRDSATKLKKLFPKLSGGVEKVIETVTKKKNSLLILLPIAILIYVFRKKIFNKK